MFESSCKGWRCSRQRRSRGEKMLKRCHSDHKSLTLVICWQNSCNHGPLRMQSMPSSLLLLETCSVSGEKTAPKAAAPPTRLWPALYFSMHILKPSVSSSKVPWRPYCLRCRIHVLQGAPSESSMSQSSSMPQCRRISAHLWWQCVQL